GPAARGGAADWSVTGWSETAASSLPGGFTLSEAYPNPFAGGARLSLGLASAQDVRITVHDVLGRRVALLHDGPMSPGAHRLVLDGATLPAGIYIVRAVGEAFVDTRRVVRTR
ncbi:MAG: T9SS type A sorting domain-containing protein, partial [Rubricoccaceae bacterium]|nr:T9SS type A sorting domain-containing protein [Rubricoccaceae bacterium]